METKATTVLVETGCRSCLPSEVCQYLVYGRRLVTSSKQQRSSYGTSVGRKLDYNVIATRALWGFMISRYSGHTDDNSS